MGRKSELPIVEKRLRLVEGDFEAMGALFPALGASVAIRKLINNYVRKVQASVAPLDISLTGAELKELLHD